LLVPRRYVATTATSAAGWYGNDTSTPWVLFPFALAFGGIAQLLAGMWSYRARDGLATAMHGAARRAYRSCPVLEVVLRLAVAMIVSASLDQETVGSVRSSRR
jgi:uncharacterized protein